MGSMVTLIGLLLIWKSIDLLVSIISSYFIPYLGLFSYGSDMFVYGLPDFIRSLSNFDGIFYIRIALKGYSQYEQAFFPLFPLFIRAVTPFVGGNAIIAGVLISNTSFFLALVILCKLLRILKIEESHILWFMIFLLAYPTAFFFGVIYTESLFLLLFVSALYFQKRERLILAFVFAYLTGLTRIIGVFLFLPLALMVFQDLYKKKKNIVTFFPKLAVIFAPVLGMITYGLFLWKTTGDPLFFFRAQEYFGAQRSTHLILLPQVIYRYIKILFTAARNFQYFVAVIELSFFAFALLILLFDLYLNLRSRKKDFVRRGLNFFSMANIILPTLTGTLISMPRFTLLSISIFFALSQIKSVSLKIVLAVFFVFLQIIFFAFFVQGYFVT